jgi:hypothetical protein
VQSLRRKVANTLTEADTLAWSHNRHRVKTFVQPDKASFGWPHRPVDKLMLAVSAATRLEMSEPAM